MEPNSFFLNRNGWVPNHERLPVLHYPGLLKPELEDLAAAMEKLMSKNGWDPEWRNGVYNFHHYHSTAHEALGIAGGEAKLLLGGPLPGGIQASVRKGDLLVLPCGTGHCLVSSSKDFLVVGAYPLGQKWDLCREAPDAAAVARMKTLAAPRLDAAGREWRGKATR